MTKTYNAGKENPRYKDGRYAGKKMTIRLTEDDDQKLGEMAAHEGVSKNEMIVRLIRKGKI